MSDPLLVYGATGYSGTLITEALAAAGLRPIVSGRDAARLAAVADRFGLERRAARLENANELRRALRAVAVVVNAAGPFSETAETLAAACLGAGAHYLDITGEIAVIEALARQDGAARKARRMLMPAVGFDVVPSDCLAAHLASRLPRASHLVFGLTGLVGATRGSAKTVVEQAGNGVKVRRGGQIVTIPPGSATRWFDFGDGPRCALNISWGDVATAYYTTGIENVEVFYEANPALRAMFLASRHAAWLLRSAPWQASLKASAELMPFGPTTAERAASRMVIVAEAFDANGRTVSARMQTPEAYTFTAVTAAALAERALRGDVEIGFQTPARVYGPDLALSFAGVVREDLG